MFNLAEYQTCAERLELFWKDHPDGRIDTKLIEASTSRFIVQAFIYRTEVDQYPWASGLAEETISGRGVNATSALENCETSSLARALANAGYSPKGDPSKRASREEMSKVEEHSKVKAEIDKVKAKMNASAGEYIPVEKAHDPWTTAPAQQAQTLESAVEMVKSSLGGTMPDESCIHGERVWKTGTSKAGKPWGHWKCIAQILGDAQRCDPIWYEIDKETGQWKPQVQR
jgi:signal recognition particle subunit SEC65